MSKSSSDFPTRLLEREEARKQAVEKRKAEKLEERGEEETAVYFTAQLDEKKASGCFYFFVKALLKWCVCHTGIEESLNNASNVAKADLPAYFDDVFTKCMEVQTLISNSSIFLSAYDLKAAQKVKYVCH